MLSTLLFSCEPKSLIIVSRRCQTVLDTGVEPAAGHTQATAAGVHPDIHSDPTADYRNLGLLQLLKKASRRRGGASLPSTTTAAQYSLSYGQTGQNINFLGRAQSSLHSYAGQSCCLPLSWLDALIVALWDSGVTADDVLWAHSSLWVGL